MALQSISLISLLVFQCVECSAKALNLLDDEDIIDAWAVEQYINDNDLGEDLSCWRPTFLNPSCLGQMAEIPYNYRVTHQVMKILQSL